MPAHPPRMFPALDDTNRGFWTGGADGILRLLRCRVCGYWIHPPRPVCPKCWRRELGWEATTPLEEGIRKYLAWLRETGQVP